MRPGGQTGPSTSEGFELDAVEIEQGAMHGKADYLVDDTRMQVRLPQPLAPKGGVLKLHIKYHYTVPGVWGGRTSWGMSKQGEIYDMAQWYPRMCVYDDLRGWDTLPYIGSEFYLEYGNFDYYITVPSAMIVAGSGELMNPGDVLTKSQIERLAAGQNQRQDDPDSHRRRSQRPRKPPQAGGTLTWHYHMENRAMWCGVPARSSCGTRRGSTCPAGKRAWRKAFIRRRAWARVRGRAPPNM